MSTAHATPTKRYKATKAVYLGAGQHLLPDQTIELTDAQAKMVPGLVLDQPKKGKAVAAPAPQAPAAPVTPVHVHVETPKTQVASSTAHVPPKHAEPAIEAVPRSIPVPHPAVEQPHHGPNLDAAPALPPI